MTPRMSNHTGKAQSRLERILGPGFSFAYMKHTSTNMYTVGYVSPFASVQLSFCTLKEYDFLHKIKDFISLDFKDLRRILPEKLNDFENHDFPSLYRAVYFGWPTGRKEKLISEDRKEK